MANHTFMGTFNNETEVAKKVEELKAQGVKENDIYIMSHDNDQVSMVRGRTGADQQSSKGNWKDEFQEFLSGDEPVREAFSETGIGQEQADRYYQEVQDGKILLFADREFGNVQARRGLNAMAAYGDPTNNTPNPARAAGQGRAAAKQNEGSPDKPHAALTSDREESAGNGSEQDETADDVQATGKDVEDMTLPDDRLNDIAPTGRNRTDIPMTDRVVDDVPLTDPNLDGIPVTTKRTDDVRLADPSVNDITELDGKQREIPTNNPNMTDVPPADEYMNDVPDADRSLDRLSDTESPEEWPLSAADRLRLRENERPEDTEKIEEADRNRNRRE